MGNYTQAAIYLLRRGKMIFRLPQRYIRGSLKTESV